MPVKHTIRTDSGGEKQVELTRRTAILAHCTECMGFGEVHPRDCPDIYCPYYSFRGKSHLAYDGDRKECEG